MLLPSYVYESVLVNLFRLAWAEVAAVYDQYSEAQPLAYARPVPVAGKVKVRLAYGGCPAWTGTVAPMASKAPVGIRLMAVESVFLGRARMSRQNHFEHSFAALRRDLEGTPMLMISTHKISAAQSDIVPKL